MSLRTQRSHHVPSCSLTLASSLIAGSSCEQSKTGTHNLLATAVNPAIRLRKEKRRKKRGKKEDKTRSGTVKKSVRQVALKKYDSHGNVIVDEVRSQG